MKKNKEIALVTGANKGIGKQIAKQLSEDGKIVIGTSRTKIGVQYINNFLNNKGEGILLNIQNPNDIKKKIKKIYEKFKSIDILVNNAGINYDNLLNKISTSEWKIMMDTNLNSIFYLSKAIISNMIKKKKVEL